MPDFVFAVLLMLTPDGQILVGDSRKVETVAACTALINETEQKFKLPEGAHWQGICLNMKVTPGKPASSDITT